MEWAETRAKTLDVWMTHDEFRLVLGAGMRLEHVVDGQRGHRHGGQRLHLHAGGRHGLDLGRQLDRAGSLGKRLYLKVEDIYGQNMAPSVTENAALKEIIIEISSKRLGATAVVKEESAELVGIITDGDLRRMLNKYDSIDGIRASDIMTISPLSIEPDTYAAEALAIMQEKNITQLIVTKSGIELRSGGILADLAPTLLKLLNIEQPVEMTGKPLY